MRYWYIWLPILIIGLLATFLLVLSDGEEYNVISTKINLARFAEGSSRSVSGGSLSTPRSGGAVGELDLSLIDRIPDNCSQPNAGYIKELFTIYALASEGKVALDDSKISFSYLIALHAKESGMYPNSNLLKSYLAWDGNKVDWSSSVNGKNLLTNTGQGGTVMDSSLGYIGYFQLAPDKDRVANKLTNINDLRHLPTQVAWVIGQSKSSKGLSPGAELRMNALSHNAGPSGALMELLGIYQYANSHTGTISSDSETMDKVRRSMQLISDDMDRYVDYEKANSLPKTAVVLYMLESPDWFVPEETLEILNHFSGFNLVGTYKSMYGEDKTYEEILTYYRSKGKIKNPWDVGGITKEDYEEFYRRYSSQKSVASIDSYMCNFKAANAKYGLVFRKGTGDSIKVINSSGVYKEGLKVIPSFSIETLDFVSNQNMDKAGKIYANMLTQACVDVDPNNPQTYTKGNIYQGESLTGNIVNMGLPTNSQISLTKVWGKEGKIKISVGGESPELISGLTGNVAVDSGKVVVYNDSGNNGIKITYTGNLTVDASVSGRGTVQKGDRLGDIAGAELEIMVEVKGATAEKYPKDLLAKRSYSKNSWYIVDPVSCLGNADLASVSVANNVGRIILDSVGEVCFTTPVYSYEVLSVLDEVEMYKQGVGQGDLNSMRRVVVKSVTPGRFKVMN